MYFDMDGPLVNFESGIARLSPETRAEYEGRLDEVPGIFGLMEPTAGGIEAFEALSEKYDTYILSTAPWGNPSAWTDKASWVQRNMSEVARKRLILSHNKHLNRGDFLIDDRPNNGAAEFEGEWLWFGSPLYPNWDAVLNRLL